MKFVYRATFTDAKPFEREFAGLLKFEAVSRAHPSQLALFHVGCNEGAGYFYYVMELADPVDVSLKCEVSSIQRVSDAVAVSSALKTENLKLSPPCLCASTLRSGTATEDGSVVQMRKE